HRRAPGGEDPCDAHALVTAALSRRLDEAEGQEESAALAGGPV
ncbi:MAG: hypothetical protein K0S40_4073, partial [Actinomycetospora sp.]|nr:hypothetical protein [Actinomycetospora sp.]